jgi:predicted nicotinamide N-methyase
MTVPEARLDPVLRRYPLRRHRLSVAGGALSIVAPDAGDWLHSGGWSARAQLGQEPPYWADVWPSSVAIARWLCRRRDLTGMRVLDLGCGIGVPGTAAASRGATVVFADRQADALAFAAFNARHNAKHNADQNADHNADHDADPEGEAPAAVQVQRHDWAASTVAGPFDLILLADVTYRPVHHEPVLRQVRAGLGHLGLAVHCDPFRRESEPFVRRLADEFCVHRIDIDTYFADARVPVRLVFLARDRQAFARFGCAASGAAAESAK